MSVPDDPIAAVREALEAVLLEVEGINSASGWPVEQSGAIPFAFVGFVDDEVTFGAQRQLDMLVFEITVLVHRKGAHLPGEVRSTEAFIAPLQRQLRKRYNLGIPYLVDRVQYTRIRSGIYDYGGTKYTGIVMQVVVKTHSNVSFG